MEKIPRCLFGLLTIALLTLAEWLVADPTWAETVQYQLTVRNDWSQAHHKPGAPPFTSVVQPHFSHLGGGTHNSDLVVWEEGGMSSTGMILMQETGWIDQPGNPNDLEDEFDDHIAAGTAGGFIVYPIPNPWFPAGTDTVLEFDIDDSHPLITLVSMLGPSPDWFIGVNGLDLSDGNRWKELVEVDLYPYDGGSKSRDDEFALFGPDENPQLPIRSITDDDDTLLLGSIPIGKFTFELLTPQPPAGDFNGDEKVDGTDLLFWQRGDSSSPIGDGDLAHWKGNFGYGPGGLSAASNSVPEPSTAALLLLASVVCRLTGVCRLTRVCGPTGRSRSLFV